MSPKPEPNSETRTPLFSVVGPAFVPEQRADAGHPVYPPDSSAGEAGVAGIWLVFYLALAAISLFTSGGVTRLIEFAAFVLQ
jgi:hypothetical protein